MSEMKDEVILVVDDDSTNLMVAQKILGKEYRIAAARSGKDAMRYLERNLPDLILLDINMPEMDGFETMERIKDDPIYGVVPVIFLTADNSIEAETRCFQMGATDFVRKPFIAAVLQSRVRRTLELMRYRSNLERLVQDQSDMLLAREKRINEMQQSVIFGMANLIESRDGGTGRHVKHTQGYVSMIANELYRRGKFPDILDEEYVEHTGKAAPMHDIGKIKISDSILQKPGKLTEEEYATMQHHTVYGAEIIKDIIMDIEDENYVRIVEEICHYHHERYDGKGYPEGLKGEEIPLCARIMAVADVFDALYAERCYKPPVRPLRRVLDILEEGKGTQFDPEVVDAFVALEPELLARLAEAEESEE